jgi:hypothetical protein
MKAGLTISCIVYWNGVSTKALRVFLASEASFLKPAPGSHAGTYFTGKVGEEDHCSYKAKGVKVTYREGSSQPDTSLVH